LSATALKVNTLTLAVEVMLQVNSTLLQVKPSTFTSVAKAATTAEVPVLLTETAAGHPIFALAEILSKTASSLLVVAVAQAIMDQVATAVRVKLALRALLVLLVYAKDAAVELDLVETAHVTVVETEVTQTADGPAVAVAPE
jgi:hypothetical protein